MDMELVHEIELYPYDTFKVLLDHEVNRARRYGTPITLIHLAVEADTSGPHAQYGAEVFAINMLNIQLRETDIPCRKGNEFLVLIPSTDEKGGRVVCERLEKLFHVESQIYDKVSFKLETFIGMTSHAGGRSISSRTLLENAEKALQTAREQKSMKAIIISE
jgi:diguanylate cyclase (GGDEF)-like protein